LFLTIILVYIKCDSFSFAFEFPMTTPSKSPPPPRPVAQHEPRPRLDSRDILGGNSAVEIDHAGQRYLLRVTRENKLILTK
jgi:hemin uptake protein HemP